MGEEGGSPGQAGWVRKQCSRGLLGGAWKERYIRLDKGRLLIYEQQGDAQCEETVDLGKYQCCQELRGLLKKRKQFRLVLVRCSGAKVPEPKFQVPNAEEKDLWLNALNEAIKEANNEQFDKVTVDEKNSLDHLTRDRVKINHSRRPPTRQHRREVASAVSDGMQRLELGVHSLTTEGTSEEQSKAKVRDNSNKNMPVLMPKIKPSKVKVDDGSELVVSHSEEPVANEGDEPAVEREEEGPTPEEGKEPAAEEGVELPTKEVEPPTKEVEESAIKEGEESAAKEFKGNALSHTVETVSHRLEDEPNLQVNVSRNGEVKKLSCETNSISSHAKSNLSRAKCSSLGDILADSKPKVMKKVFKAPYAGLKKEKVEQMEGEIALELKVTEELLQQVCSPGDDTEGVHRPQSDITRDSQSNRNAARLLSEAVAKWSEADKVLQELKDLKELCTRSDTLTLEEKERRKNLLTVHRRSVP
ncbi:pleckstrin homology domain-containing family O member 2-like isoform X1 [Hypanus sabinus]|uniref:pleckstrin homology domain-containing family O member 2-like isoform X1 n=1 Tax=Hypanus sabinus TaxID=79690 RepID=UPI0028C48831|nr:pleckstrin homology domain-containing family O member 2-like isoform X1 [Hypanus sabinus]